MVWIVLGLFVVARKLEDLVVWQLASEVAARTLALSATDAIRREYKFCSQLESAARSVPANVAEGFARFKPKDFARFLRYARGSAAELEVYLDEAVARHWIDDSEAAPIRVLIRRFSACSARLTRYLESAEPPNHAGAEPTK
jgi:four helix bundle protein